MPEAHAEPRHEQGADGAPAALTELLSRICAVAPSVVAWKNVERGLEGVGDLDLFAAEQDLTAIERAARAWVAERAGAPPLVCRHVPGEMTVVARIDGRLVTLDIKTRGTWHGGTAFTARHALALSSSRAGIRRLRSGAEALFTLVLNGMAGWGKGRPGRLSPARTRQLIEADPEGLRLAAIHLGPARRAARRLVREFAGGGWHRPSALWLQAVVLARIIRAPVPAVQKVWFRTSGRQTCHGIRWELGRNPGEEAFARWLPRHAEHGGRARGRPGKVVMVTGPDGVGKTSLLLRLQQGVLADLPTRWIHHRDGVCVLPGRPRRDVVSRPHEQEPYSFPLAVAKVVFLWIDLVAGWLFRVRPVVRRGGWVTAERYWWDMLIDQRRYRLHRVGWFLRLLGRLVPRPDLVLRLEAPAEVIRTRKSELGIEELERQTRAWREVLPGGIRVVSVDAAAPFEEVVARAEGALEELAAWAGVSWTGGPSLRSPRFWTPRAPRPAAHGGLCIYHPVTPKGRLAWSAARAAARLGLFRLLPSVRPPPILASLREHLGDASSVAIARSTQPGRYTAIGLGTDGRGIGVVKLALDRPGRAALADEAVALRSLRSEVGPRVAGPELRANGDGVLVLEPIAWLPRRRPWVLPPEVAAALGAFFARGAAEGIGPVHGDCAPWNLLRTRGGWVLIDWERAGEGPPFRDLVHHVVQSHAYLGRPRTQAIVAGLRGRGRLGRAIAAYAREAGQEGGGAAPAILSLLREPPDESEIHDARAPAARAAKRRLLERLEREGFDG